MSGLSVGDRLALLALAREAAEAGVAGRPLPRPHLAGSLAEPRGAFVTLKRRMDGDLRGCIGRIEAREALGITVAQVAVAATRDRRFEPVSSEELEGIRIEVSVLTPPVPVAPDGVEVGRHGLIVQRDGSSGLLLPQVPVEHGWDRDTFLSETCRKAGLRRDVWRDGGTVLLAFTAEVFGE